ncbi:tautomerase family protein [Leminorella grimontii]|uniref:tautomerase family protein n=1 Tax=Leminorella grimontii TaxID=82981 RepID=UPI00208CEC4E|nr:tautomerase family protein [Leminorella grimontii]GKX59652.1 putative tautomerase YusQ [Leminorella grimontii]
MPFTRIILREGYGDARLRQISDVLHQALVDTFAVPQDDRFQVIEALPAGRRVYHPRYLTGQRSEDFILFHIVAGKPRSREQKAALYQALSARLHAEVGIEPDDVMVVIQFTHPEDWSFGNGVMFELPK